MRLKFTGLWRHADFVKLWGGETISLFGSQVTLLALPLTAILVLKASPVEMGILGAVEFAPFLLLSLFAGVWVDRLPRRPILILADLGRALLIFSIPLIFWLGWLRIELLYLVGFLTGVLTVFFDLAYQSYLPSLVEREQLVEGNSKLEVSRSVAQIAGPGLAGTLIQVVSAPVAMALDALSFLASAFFIGLIRKPEPVKKIQEQTPNIWKEIGEGLGVVFGSRYLRSIAGCTGTSNLFSNITGAVFALYVIRELKLEPALLGFIFGAGSVGALFGALASGWIARRFGLGRTIIVSALMYGAGGFFTLLTFSLPQLSVALLVTGFFIVSFFVMTYNINQVSLRQAVTPDRLLGRMNASIRFLVWGTMPIGSVLGGILGELIGLQGTLLVGVTGGALSFLWVLFSPVRILQKQPGAEVMLASNQGNLLEEKEKAC